MEWSMDRQITDRYHYLFLIALLGLYVAQGALLVYAYSVTYDEHAHTAAGVTYLNTGKFSGGWNNPPFLQTLLGLPYYLGLSKYEIFTVTPPHAARFSNLILATLLALVIYAFARLLFGKESALLATSLYCCSPSFVAHGAQATLDVGVCLFTTLTALSFYLAHRYDRYLFVLLTGVFLGLSVASKFTVLVMLGMVPLLLLLPEDLRMRGWLPFLRDTFTIYIVAFLVFCATYSFAGCLTHKKTPFNQAFLQALCYLAPEQAVTGFGKKIVEGYKGSVVYLFGEYSKVGFKYYYLAVFLVKTLPGTLICLVILLWLLFRTRDFPQGKWAIHLWLPLLFYSLPLQLFNKAQTGVRHLFPFYPFLFIAISALCTSFYTDRKTFLVPFVALVVTLNLATVFYVHSTQLSYVNSLGWALSKDRFPLCGPDIDWGHADFYAEQVIEGLPNNLPVYLNPRPYIAPKHGYIVVSCNCMLKRPPGEIRFFDYLTPLEPIKEFGGSWLLFRNTEEDMLRRANEGIDEWSYQDYYARYLYFGQRHQELVDFLNLRKKLFGEAHYLLARSLIMLGRYEEALLEMVKLEQRSEKLKGNRQLWKEVATLLAGKGTGSKERQTARAFGMLILLDPDVVEPLLEKLLQLPLFAKPPSPKHPLEELRFAWGMLYVHKRQFILAHRMLSSLSKDRVDSAVVDFHLTRMDNYLTMSTKMRGDLELQHKVASYLMHLGAPEPALSSIKQFLERDPNDFEAIKRLYWLIGNQKLGFCNFDSGLDSIYDRTDPDTTIYRKKGTQ